MAHDVRAEVVEVRPIASIRTTIPLHELAACIGSGLGRIWPALRGLGVPAGNSIVLYHDGDATKP